MDLAGVSHPSDISGYSMLACAPGPEKTLGGCVVCGSHSAKETSREELWVVGIDHVSIGYGYCAECGHINQVDPVPDDKLAAYYEKFGNYTLNFERDDITERLCSLSAHFKSVYEVGCGTGRHLAAFKERGQTVWGCEPSKAACDAGRERFGIDITCGTEEECLPEMCNLDLIVYSGVLEHLPDPVASLRRAHAALAHDGYVLVEVPCATAPDLLPPGWFAFEHLHYFTDAALVRMLARAGFAAIEVRINYKDYIYPVITVLALRGTERELPPIPEQVTAAKQFIEEYNARDAAIWAKTEAKLFGLGHVFIWGAGIHTSQLLYRVNGIKIAAFVDRDPQKHGKFIGTVPVISIKHFESFGTELPIVISSYANEAAIAESLAGKRVIRLYA